jgi:hypothetical protein
MFTPSSTPGVSTLYCLSRRMERRTENLPRGITSPPGEKSPLGDNFAPGGQSFPLVKNGPQHCSGFHYILLVMFRCRLPTCRLS